MEEIEKYVVVTIANEIKRSKARTGRIWRGSVDFDPLEQLTVKAMNQIDKEAEFDYVITVPPGGLLLPGPYNRDHMEGRRSVVPNDVSGIFNRFQQESEYGLDDRIELRKQAVIADTLGILDEEVNGTTLRKLLKSIDDLDYYQYLHNGVELRGLTHHLATKIYAKLIGKRYLIRCDVPTFMGRDEILSMGLPLPDTWNKSWWLTAYNNLVVKRLIINQGIGEIREFWIDPYNLDGGELYAKGLLPLQASCILPFLFPMGVKNIDYMDAVKAISDCYLYFFLFLLLDFDARQIQEDELVKYWIEDGIIARLLDTNRKLITEQQHENELEAEDEDKYSSFLFDTGKAILDQFVTRSMLARNHPYINSHGVYFTGVGESLYPSKLPFMPPFEWSEDKKHISFVRAAWISESLPSDPPRCVKLTTLILRACTELDGIMDGLLQHMPCLRVLDLSYTDLKFLPSSLFCLKNLRLLSLRGCWNLESLAAATPSSPSQSLPALPLYVLPSLRVLDLSCPNLISLSPPIEMPELRELFLNGCSLLSSVQTPFLELLTKLRVLRLTGSQITAFQESTFSRMEWLRVLDLSNNLHLVSLPGSLSNAIRLKEVHVFSCRALEDLKAIRSAKRRFFSFVDNNSLTILPDPLSDAVGVLEEIHLQDCRALTGVDAIGGCAGLRILSLVNIIHLKSLPESFSKLHNLEELYIAQCTGLDSIDLGVYGASKLRVLSLVNNYSVRSLPKWLRRAQVLVKLHLENCIALKEIKMEGSCTNITSFFLSGSPIVELSLMSCRNLKAITLRDLPELEVLDLSFTRISEFPAEIFALPKLRRFNMLASHRLRRFPWHAIPRLPKEFNLDNCSSSYDSNILDVPKIQLPVGDDDASSSRIFVDDPQFFCSLSAKASESLLGNVRHPSQFHVYISKREKEYQHTAGTSSTKEAVARRYSHVSNARKNWKYRDAYRPTHQYLCRHLTMKGIDQFPYRPFPLLDSMDLLSVSDDRSLVTLAGLSPMGSLKECELKQCHNMEYAFEVEETRWQGLLSVLWVSGHGKLTVLCRRSGVRLGEAGEFRSLQHLHLDHCRMLESMFPVGFNLPSLETLTIKYCDSLKEIFFDGGEITDNVILLPKLRTVCLLELPRLLHFCREREARMPALKEFEVRGCWRLYRLPLIGTAATTAAAAGGGQVRGCWRLYRIPLIGTAATTAAAAAASASYSNNDHQQQQQQVVVDVGGELEWWNRLIWDHYRIDGSVMNRHIRFRARPRFATWEPTVRGRFRRSMAKH